MNVTSKLSHALTQPLELAKSKFCKCADKENFQESLPARAFLVLQVISSLFAIKMILLVGLLETGYNFATDKDWEKSLGQAAFGVGKHAILAIGSAIGTVMPSRILAERL